MKLIRPKRKKTAGIYEIKPGNVLIAQNFSDNKLLHRSVILILEHDETGSTGIILNKANIVMESHTSPGKNNFLYGGTYDAHRVGFIHKIKDLSRTIKISDEIYYNENSSQLQDLISADKSEPGKVKAFIGFTVWQEGQLEQEIGENKWWIDTFKLDELYKAGEKDLWEYKLLESQNVYGLFCDVADPCMN